MDVGIGLPNAVPGTTGEQLVEWAKRAEARGFSTLGTIDRLTYGNYEPLVALAAAAAVTERIGLCTSVLLAPLRGNAASLAKQTLSLQALSGGRFTLGIAIGGREDDYEEAGVDIGERGETIDAMLDRIKEVWAGKQVGPTVDSPPTLLIGGGVEASFERAARVGDGWIAGGSPPELFAQEREQVEAAWSAAGRDGTPKAAGLAYFSLGEKAEENANAYLTDYYAWLGEETANFIAGAAAKDADTVKQYLAAYEGAGCDELILFPSSSDPEQVDLLADAAGLSS
jgi:alkanesulfonate monooxygenase SsuD/methylene tetrahydromethanopterin reductase-like flavin-dependent oxidoreductase (luciferase family)